MAKEFKTPPLVSRAQLTRRQNDRLFCAHLRRTAQPLPAEMHPAVAQFLAGGTERRILVKKGIKALGVCIEPYEIFSTIAVMPAVRSAILTLWRSDPDAVLGDLKSLLRNEPIVYEYVPLKNKWGRNRRGRPRKVQVSGNSQLTPGA